MLLRWKEKRGAGATYKVLYEALCHEYVDRKDLAQQFCTVWIFRSKREESKAPMSQLMDELD